MKLREYGFIIWTLAETKNIDNKIVGDMAYELSRLVEDWSKDNDIRDNNNIEWIQESYTDWVGAKT